MSQAALRIGLVGGECTGKTTLAAALGRALPACVVPEALRAFVERSGRAPRADEQRGIMLEQRRAEDEAARTCGSGILVTDSAPLMVAVYSVVYFDDDSLIDDAVELARDYRLVLWCDVDVDWEPDGLQRDGPAMRARADAVLEQVIVDRLDAAAVRVVKVSGDVAARVRAARTAWQLLASSEPT